ncbi:MAG: hypothetical protein O7B27_08300 [Gammaproteobacteria bacterium]|nr:hypothetical protein [Gammaproteobacteria bacterium]
MFRLELSDLVRPLLAPVDQVAHGLFNDVVNVVWRQDHALDLREYRRIHPLDALLVVVGTNGLAALVVVGANIVRYTTTAAARTERLSGYDDRPLAARAARKASQQILRRTTAVRLTTKDSTSVTEINFADGL